MANLEHSMDNTVKIENFQNSKFVIFDENFRFEIFEENEKKLFKRKKI